MAYWKRQAGFRSLKDALADATTPHGRLMLTVSVLFLGFFGSVFLDFFECLWDWSVLWTYAWVNLIPLPPPGWLGGMHRNQFGKLKEGKDK